MFLTDDSCIEDIKPESLFPNNSLLNSLDETDSKVAKTLFVFYLFIKVLLFSFLVQFLLLKIADLFKSSSLLELS